jgi:exodeoxyribonuclease VII small subunit
MRKKRMAHFSPFAGWLIRVAGALHAPGAAYNACFYGSRFTLLSFFIVFAFFCTIFSMPKPLPPQDSAMPATYESALQELEALVARVESGQMPLDDVLGAYQRGAVLLKFCRDKLAAVEQQIKVLDGEAAKPWTQE